MKNLFKVSTLTLALSSCYAFADNSIQQSTDDSVVEAGDLLQLLIPATGLFATWLYDDLEGTKQWTYSVLTTSAVVHLGKATVGRKRPNGSSWSSFPSGHTAAAFSGAAFLQSRYGAKWGVPAYTAATFVGASRIHGNRHYADDVVAGASIAFLVNQYFVSSYQMEGINFNAQPTDDGFKLNVNVSNAAFDKKQEAKVNTMARKSLKHRIELGIGTNLVDSAAQAGAALYIADSEPVDKYQPFAYVNYLYQMHNNNQYELEFSPNETRRSGIVSEAFELDGETFSKGEQLFTAYRHWMLGNNLYKGLSVNKDFNVAVGLGAYVHLFALDVAQENTEKEATEEHWRLMPSATVKGQYFFTDDFSTLAKAQYQFWESDSYLYAEAGINYQISREWDIGFKYGYSQTQLDNNVFATKFESNTLLVTFANRF